MRHDYYVVLGISPDAPDEEIRAAYRRLARRHHPDVSGDEGEHFVLIQEAYDTLRDPSSRRDYDRARANQQPAQPQRSFDARRFMRAEAPRELAMQLILSAAEARHGGDLPISVPQRLACTRCAGRGATSGWACNNCGGTGVMVQLRNVVLTVPPGVEHGTLHRVQIPATGQHELTLTILVTVST